MTLQEFSEVFVVLAAQLQHAADAPEIRLYYRVFGDLDRELVAAAADELARGAAVNDEGHAWFPKAPEWRRLALKIAHDRKAAQQQQLSGVLNHVCAQCEDTGWARETDDQGIERVHRCACQDQRRAELLGRAKPPPQLGGTR